MSNLGPAPVSAGGLALSSPMPFLRVSPENLSELRSSWCWFLTLGAALVFLGLLAMSFSILATLATALTFGFVLLAAGICYIVGAFFTRSWGGFFLSLLAGVLNLVVGIIVLDRPGEAVLIYTLLLAVFFFVEGLFRIVGAILGRFRHWLWMLLNGVVTLALGVMIWRQWPASGLYVIGVFLGINLLVSGINYFSLGLALRKLPAA